MFYEKFAFELHKLGIRREWTQDVDLDAILGELSALEHEYEDALRSTSQSPVKSVSFASDMHGRERHSVPLADLHHLASSLRLSGDISSSSSTTKSSSTGARTHSPDNDSAFSDSVSLLSSESSTSGSRHVTFVEPASPSSISSPCETSIKAEKIRAAMQKIKDASVKKIFIKVFNDDGSVKSLLVDESMTCGYITRVLAEKNHRPYDPRCALVEHLTELNMERVYEENEILVTELMRWTYSSKNQLHFAWDRVEKTLLVDAPWLFTGVKKQEPVSLPPHHHSVSMKNLSILEDFFAGSGVPCIEGPLYIKSDSSKKVWKKYHCVLRSSGLYYWPKEKSKCSSKDLQCLATFDLNTVYYGVDWKKKFKAPTDFCFALKPPAVQDFSGKSSKSIKCLCATDLTSLHTWVTAIRTAKYGKQMLTDYQTSLEYCNSEDLSSGFAAKHHMPIPSSASSSSSSSSGCDVGFEADYLPCGTIKRKPAKIPLTTTTRQLKSAAVGDEIIRSGASSSDAIHDDEELPPPPPELMVDEDDEIDDTDSTYGISIGQIDKSAPLSQSRSSLFFSTSRDPEFLRDLHRVVEKKWQVAEKCRLEQGASPHQVLGFRHYDRSLSVSKWLEEHYGSPFVSAERGGTGGSSGSGGSTSSHRGRAPPPPPRAPTTVLTRR
ncbi:Growth factor receptor-bound protein [Nesidiocoris tenuis]|uniref:Growth factor receptor-bound protein n=1 Tax=Nesidiocoris tenuis TaxID=355587 RepID=A0ABN7B7Q2_9HEMI|nr:Growth factor receptor-bound protein [Nesidiocoris tenuis]